jgi:hypothetical protein
VTAAERPGWCAARAADPAGWAMAEALDTQGGRDSTHYRDAVAGSRYPGQTAPGVDIGPYVRAQADPEAGQ